jgi:murein L,D-transpeptidase YcbB/YkuD
MQRLSVPRVENGAMKIAGPASRFVRCGALAMTLCLCAGSATATAADGLLWFHGGRPGPQAGQAVELLAGAASQGLEPQDYAADALQQAVARAAQGPPLGPAAIERLDLALTTAMERYLTDLHGGRIDPRHIDNGYTLPQRDEFDPAATLNAALAAGHLADAAQAAAPRMPQYERLRQALARFCRPVRAAEPARWNRGRPTRGWRCWHKG